MQRFAAIALVVWIFGFAPVLCEAGYLAHACEAICPICQSESCPGGHECQHDPCRVDAARQASNDFDEIPMHAADATAACLGIDIAAPAARPAPNAPTSGPDFDAPGLDCLLAVNLPLIV